MRLQSLILKLQEIAATKGDTQMVLIVRGVAYPIDEVWWEPHQRGFDAPVMGMRDLGAVCIGDDPR